MRIGVPGEIKIQEGRVALIPDAVDELIRHDHQVFIQSGAGEYSGYDDEAYRAHGAQIVATAEELFEAAELIVKVKEPQPGELEHLRADHVLFSYLHLAAAPQLTRALRDIGLTAVAFETVIDAHHRLPLLAPMSDIAGRIASQTGSNLLYHHRGGRGVLLGGVPATERGQVVILGAGVAGTSAARMAAGMGAQVTVFDHDRDKLQQARLIGPNVTGRHAYTRAIEAAVPSADLLIGAVLIPGAKAPHLVSAETVRQMPAGSVIIDISVDQGGCIETTRATSYEEPTFLWEGVLHYGVTNMPGAVPRTASQALSAALVPYILRLAEPGWENQPDLAAGLNLRAGRVLLAALQSM
ncbi:alanine dehydrogenase [Thiohalophilus sp.]|uniref:alanine dehydrogenase n=1 Tax=Thiohalophilus sp. TaxID=3028392 RepID=UPI003975E349